jgi:hypothetical protein
MKITEKELNTAAKLASRKVGVTRQQLAEKLAITADRAATVIARIKPKKAVPLGEGAGKQNRTLVFFA